MKLYFYLFLISVSSLLTIGHSGLLNEEIEKKIKDEIEREDASKVEQKAGLFEGDIDMDQNEQEAWTSGKITERDAVNIPIYYWPGGKMYYSLHSSLDSFTIDMIHKAIKHIEQHTCIRFYRYNNQPDQHHVEYFKGNGCYSRIGRDPRKYKQMISIGCGCERLGTIVHESMHSLGFFHEHTRQDRDRYVHIQWPEIIRKFIHNFKKYPRNLGTSLGKPYDYLSVLHYSRYAFARNGAPTIRTRKPHAIIGQRLGLSFYDAYEINKLYQCRDYQQCFDRKHPFICARFKKRCHIGKFKRVCKRTCGLCHNNRKCFDRLPKFCNRVRRNRKCNVMIFQRFCRRSCRRCWTY